MVTAVQGFRTLTRLFKHEGDNVPGYIAIIKPSLHSLPRAKRRALLYCKNTIEQEVVYI